MEVYLNGIRAVDGVYGAQAGNIGIGRCEEFNIIQAAGIAAILLTRRFSATSSSLASTGRQKIVRPDAEH
jgi:hypothetical protein